MAVQETTVPIDDKGMLADIMSESQTPQAEEAAPAVDERPRDDQGRFAPKTEQPEVEAKPVEATPEQPVPEVKDDGAQVPSWRLRELREAREAAERRAEDASRQNYAFQEQMRSLQRELAALKQPKQEPVDFFADPEAALKQRITPIQSEFEQAKQEMRLEFSRELAVIKHGEQTVADMEKHIAEAMQQGHPELPSLSARMRTSNNPTGVAMQWFQQQKLVKETGGNLETYRQRILDEAMKDPTYQAKVLEATRSQVAQQPPGTRPNIQLPPSLSRAPGSGVTAAEVDAGDLSDGSLFKYAMGGKASR